MDDSTYQDTTNLIIQYGIYCEKEDPYKEIVFSLIKEKLQNVPQNNEPLLNKIQEYGTLCQKHGQTNNYQDFLKQEERFKSICNMLLNERKTERQKSD